MLRFTIALLVAVVASGATESADQTVARRGWHRTAIILPAGLPRPHYNFRTTISDGAPYAYRRTYAPRVYGYETAEVLFTPVTYKIVGALKRAENEDYYDRNTDFTPFTLKA